MEKIKEARHTILSEIAPENWSEGVLNTLGMSKNSHSFQGGDKVKWMPSAEEIKNNSNLKPPLFGIFPRQYTAYIKSINDDGSISIEVYGIGDNNQFVVRDLLSLGHTTP